MHQTGVLVLPPFLPCAPALGVALAEFLRVGNIADGRIKPHVEHLAFGSLHGNGDAPVQVARHGAGLEVHVEPRFALAVYIRAPFLMTFQNPLLQPILIFVQRQIPVLGLLQHRLRTADGTLRIDELGGRKVASAFLTLVAVGTFVVAMGTFAGDIAVGQELLGLLVVILHGSLFHQLPFIVELAEEVAGKLMVRFRSGTRVHVE